MDQGKQGRILEQRQLAGMVCFGLAPEQGSGGMRDKEHERVEVS